MSKLKSRCTWCHAKIPKTDKHFATFGNSCRACSVIFSQMCKGKLNAKGHKERSFTVEEKEEMMQKRRNIVKSNKL